jgi:hypothetical protein
VHVAHRSASLCAFSTPLCDQCCGLTAQTFFVQPWGGPKTKPHIRHIHCRWFSWNSSVICLQVVKLLLALLLLSAILSCIMFGKGVWVRGAGEGGGSTGEPNTQHVRSSSIGADKNKQHLLQTSRLHVWNVAGLGFNCNPHILA